MPPAHFPDLFRAVWDYDPFPWQSMLAERVAAGSWPQALDLPTASGKTACIDIALYALAAQADHPTAERTAPRRVWFVVDRRIVVDEAFARAERIAKKLSDASDGPLREVADRLRAVAGTDRPLAVARLRGGVLRDDGWARLPSQPAVITSTVDQLGSRLLFRGYGRSLLAAPIYAGLAANDSLILLDEAHCAVPFMQTLRAVADYRGARWAEQPVTAPFAFAILSATPPEGFPEDELFPGPERDRALDHPVLRRRLLAAKRAELVELKSARAAAGDPLIAAAADRAAAYVERGKRRVAVMVNRVHTAGEIAVALRARLQEAADVVLLTGRLRPFDRDQLVERWTPFLRASEPRDPPRPIVVVCTQSLEVGADYSFDALVTEAASLDALRQRFGRLDRMGTAGESNAAVLVRDQDADPEKSEPDPIYGAAIANTWKLLTEQATDGAIDFGVEALNATVSAAGDLSQCLAPTADAPVLLPAHLDLLCQTAPPPEPEPDVQLCLHGKDHGAAEAQVVWRADLSDDTRNWAETVALSPPVGGEMLSVPLYRLRAFLTGAGPTDDAGDVEGVLANTVETAARSRPFVLWRGRDRTSVEWKPGGIAPGDVVVLPASYGIAALGQATVAAGLGADGLDLWERTLEAAGKPLAVRLNRAVLAAWTSCPAVAELMDLAHAQDCDRDALADAVQAVLEYEPAEDGAPPAPPQWWKEILRGLQSRPPERHPAGGVILFGSRATGSRRSEEADLFADDDDLTSASGREVSLDEHCDLVERTAVKLADRCLTPAHVEIVRLAAHWHDTGKLDERFQVLLRHGDVLAALSGEAPLAKSAFIPASPARRRQIRDAAGIPTDFRHEMLSVQLAERHALLPPDAEARDLFLHLVASHHGHARPFAPVCLDDNPPAVSGERGGTAIALSGAERAALPPAHRLDSGISERFWRLVRRHGWWGLVYLEAILRLSDWYASELAVQPREPVREEATA